MGKREKAKAEKMYKKEKQLFQRDPHPEIRFPGGLELPMMAYEEGSTQKGYLFHFGACPQVYERVGISLVE